MEDKDYFTLSVRSHQQSLLGKALACEVHPSENIFMAFCTQKDSLNDLLPFPTLFHLVNNYITIGFFYIFYIMQF